MTASATKPLQSRFGPSVADAAGTIVQEASDVLEYSHFRVCELLNPNAGRVLVTGVLALEFLVPPSALEEAPAGHRPTGRAGVDAEEVFGTSHAAWAPH